MFTQTTSCLLLGASALLYLLYKLALPKPIPDIPYSPQSLRPFHDILAAHRYQREHDQAIGFFVNRIHELQSPIIQVFMRPFGKLWIIISDSLVTEEILNLRTREFDIAPWISNLVLAAFPASFLPMKTNEAWRRQRRIVNDIMANAFQHHVAAPRIREMCLAMVGLWVEKVRLVGDRPFSAAIDIEDMMLDTICAVSFGTSYSTRHQHKELLQQLDRTILLENKNLPVDFPEPPRPEQYVALVGIANSSEIPMRSPFGLLHHQMALKLYPRLRKAMRIRENMITEKLDIAWTKVNNTEKHEISCAADLIVQQEIKFAEREGRPAQYDSRSIQDDLAMFVQAGNDTTATTLQWALIYLSAEQEVQQKLREALQQEFDDKAPSALDMAKASLPYLDATIEETLRLGAPVPFLSRETEVDCQIMGHFVPAKTMVMMPSLGPSYRSQAIKKASDDQSKIQNPFTGAWDPQSLGKFQPERWLETSEDGTVRFNARAGPSHAMGIGPRHCFGKRQAMMTLRIELTLILLAFQLLPLPKELENFTPMDKLTHRPVAVNIRLRRL